MHPAPAIELDRKDKTFLVPELELLVLALPAAALVPKPTVLGNHGFYGPVGHNRHLHWGMLADPLDLTQLQL